MRWLEIDEPPLKELGLRNGAVLVGVDEAHGGVETERPEGQSEAESEGRELAPVELGGAQAEARARAGDALCGLCTRVAASDDKAPFLTAH